MKQAKRLQSLMLGVSLTMASMPLWAVNDSQGGPAVRQLNLQPPVTQIAREIYDIHNIVMGVCLVIMILVFGVMFYSILKHRKSLGHKPATFHESTAVEIGWTVVPFLIVIGMALPATKTVIAMKDTSNADLTIKVTGMQWKWGYEYVKGDGEGINFLSNLATPRTQVGAPGVTPSQARGDNYLLEVDNAMVVPANKKVRLVLTANDVIHSWTIPAFGVKQDAIPGFVRDTWFKAEQVGTYRGNCVELCGKEHAFMPIVVNVVSEEDYKKWVTDKKKELGIADKAGDQLAAAAPGAAAAAVPALDPSKPLTLADLSKNGEKVFAANCASCHQATGKGIPGTFPALDGSAVVNGPKAEQIKVVLNGRNAMPAWKQLSDTDIASVITYTRNAWSNKAKENLVQPADIVAARK